MKRLALFACTFALACAADTIVSIPLSQSRSEATGPSIITHPSVAVILLDDATYGMVDRQTMPKLYAWVADSGLTFTHGVANTSLCCPSRSGMFKGLDQHATRVFDNSYPNGFAHYVSTGTVFTAMPPEYITMLDGKYLNNWATNNTTIPPGVDEARIAKHIANTQWRMSYENYTLVERSWLAGGGVGNEIYYSQGVSNYQPYVLARHFENFLTSLPASTPFLAFITPLSPHKPAHAAPQDIGSCSSLPPYHPPGYRASRVGQPKIVINAVKTTPVIVSASDNIYYRTCETLRSADRMIDSIFIALAAHGRLSSTYVIVTSDNGYHFGEQDLFDRKATPFEASTHVPFFIRGPGVVTRVDNTHFAQIIDITPTVLDLAGVPGALLGQAGRSLVPLFSSIPVGGYNTTLIEGLVPGTTSAQRYSCVKDFQWKYCEFGTGPKALYNMTDPVPETHNLAGQAPYASVQSSLAAQLATLKIR